MLQWRLRAAKAKARIQFAGASEMHDTGGRLTCDRGWRMSKLRPLLPAPPLMHHCGKRLRRAASAAKPPAPLQVALARCPPQQTKRACAGPSSSASYQRATRRRLRCFVAGLPAANKALCRGCAKRQQHTHFTQTQTTKITSNPTRAAHSAHASSAATHTPHAGFTFHAQQLRWRLQTLAFSGRNPP